jgi:NADP-dependent 3-hydroxy acid dehydrogenase YdfG
MAQDREAFEGGVAVITGAGAGLGEGMARRAAELGMKVVLADVALERASALADEFRARGAEAVAMAVDVSRPAELDRLAADVYDRFGEVRLLINNAGIETVGNTWEIPLERWEKTLDINIHGVVHGCRAFLPRMLESGKPGWVANLSSIGGFGQMPAQTAYIMTKHAVQAFSECLALEVQVTGKPIHVASIIPGMVKTRIFDAVSASEGETGHASAHRKAMHDMMAAHGMDLAHASQTILEQLAAKKFWVSTQPEMTDQAVEGRIAFFNSREAPVLHDFAKQMLGLQ